MLLRLRVATSESQDSVNSAVLKTLIWPRPVIRLFTAVFLRTLAVLWNFVRIFFVGFHAFLPMKSDFYLFRFLR